MITLQQICRFCDELLAPREFSDQAINGLQVEGRSEVRRFATAVTASLSTIEAAVRAGVDLLIVHHGLFWQRDSPVIQGPKRAKLEKLLENRMSLVAYHLPLDAHPEVGNNWCAARELGWEELRPFAKADGKFLGVIGRLPRVERHWMQRQLEAYYEHPAHTAFGGGDVVETAALLSGGGYRFLAEAAQAGADSFVTGSFDEPAWHVSFEERINFFALGHAATEKVGPKALGQRLSQELDLPWQFLHEENPF